MSGLICFTAGIADEILGHRAGLHIPFNKVLTNRGNAYDPKTGVFRAPVDGAYVINVDLSITPGYSLDYEVVLDNVRLAEIKIQALDTSLASVSKQWVLELKTGSTVSVRALRNGEIRGLMFSSFSGWKLEDGRGAGGDDSTDAGTEWPSDATDISKFPEMYENEIKRKMKRYDVLRDLDIFVLDNSMRESTVGQLKGHTPEDKWEIFDEVKKCGFKHTIVASFAHETRVDDVFIKQLVARGEDKDYLYGFSEISDGVKGGVPNTKDFPPIGVRKMQEVGLYNIIFEIDLGDHTYDFEKFSIDEMCQLVLKLITYCHDHLHEKAKVLFNFRDLPDAMHHPSRVFKVVDFMAKLPPRLQMFGIMFEEPRGKSMPEECSTWARYFRKIMDNNNWKGNLLVHVHEKFGYVDVMPLEVMMGGANGIWASVCLEGAVMGNAASCVTLTNLVRLGNKKVLEKFNCQYLRQAAINVTKITTGNDPHIKQPVYGARATDFVFDLNKEEFDLAEFFGEKAPIRMTTMASKEMIQKKLINVFGDNPQFTLAMGQKMREKILEDMRNERKEEYMSKYGLAILFDRCGGSLTGDMRDVLANGKELVKSPHYNNLIAEIRGIWDTWDLRDKKQNDDLLEYMSFYNGFMSPWFSCYKCSDTLKGMKAIDMDDDGFIDWNEFKIYLTWAFFEYPEVANADELLEIAFMKGIVPAMRDELLTHKEKGTMRDL